MRFITSIMTLASIVGALMVLYVGAGTLLKVNRSSDEDKLRTAGRAAAMVTRIAQNNGALAKMKINDNALFGSLNFNFNLPPDSSGSGEEPKGYGAGVPQPPAVQPSPWAQPPFPVFPAPVPWVPRIIPRPTPTPAEEALGVYRKYATP